MKFRFGRVLKRKKGLLWHVGLEIEPGLVLHNTPERGEHVSPVEEFADGESVVAGRPIDLNYHWSRICDILRRPSKYNVFFNNCEHTLTKIFGKPESQQVVAGVALSALALLVFVGAK